MKINLKKLIGIMILIIAFEIVYLIGFYTPNKVTYGNSEDEISAEVSDEIVDEISNEDLEIEIENLISDEDLTEEVDDDIIITDEDVCDVEPLITEDGYTHEDIIFNECKLWVDYMQLVDCYEDGNWYCYYIYSDGDCYVVTLKNDHVDICVMLN